jgi:hypothetical protein
VNDRLFRDPGFPIGVSWRILAPAGMSTKGGEAHAPPTTARLQAG